MSTYDFQCSKCKAKMRIRVMPVNAKMQIYCLTCGVLVFNNSRSVGNQHMSPGTKPAILPNSQRTPLPPGSAIPPGPPMPTGASMQPSNLGANKPIPPGGQLGQSFSQIRVPPTSSSQPTPAPPAKKRIIKERYLIQNGGLLGEGAMGKVYLAFDNKNKENVAIKILTNQNEKLRDYFKREAMVLNDLNHPNIVSFKDCGSHEGSLFIVMEYIEGGTLSDYLDRHKVVVPRHAAQLMLSVLSAIQYAYEHNIVHRDIKPSNIFITKNRVVKVIDLGLGKVITESLDLTKTGQIMGTGFYMPLEQIQKSKDANHSADIYASGATLYHAISGVPPFEECGKDLAKLFSAKIKNNYIRLKERNNNLPDELVGIVEKAMGHRPENRYKTAQQMKQDIEAFLQKKPHE